MAGTALEQVLSEQLADSECQWSVGAFGALAEFARDAGETFAASADGRTLVTGRGGIRIAPGPDVRLAASEGVTRESWNHRVALCLPEARAAMSRRQVLTELGPDAHALRDQDRDAVLFDLGLGTFQVDACIRVADPAVAAALRPFAGRNVFDEPGAMSVIVPASPHRVFVSRVGRIEVFQPIPPPDGRSPEGPHTHVLPKLLRQRRTHAATEPVPDGFVPCAHFYPAHPVRDSRGRAQPFDAARHAAFQALLGRFGDPAAVALKRRVAAAVERGEAPAAFEVANDRFARAAMRVALRQLQASRGASAALAAWAEVHDRSSHEAEPAHA